MKNLVSLLLIFSCLVFYSCKSTQPARAENTSERYRRGSSRAAHLEAFLPKKILGVKRSTISTERQELEEKAVIAATGEYKGADQILRITITDAARVTGGLTKKAPWTAGKLDNKWEQGYERTADIEGYQGYESYDFGDQSGQSSIVVNQRYIVSVDGERIAEGDTRKVLKAVDLKKLASFK
jgi:hypothetical protein